jgi:LPXTG-motif cell wall-anchored protein
MRIVRRLCALALVAGGLLLPSGVAAAEPYPIVPPQLSVSAATVVVGSTVTVTGVGYQPNETVSIDSTVQATAIGRLGRVAAAPVDLPTRRATTVVADDDGAFTVPLTVDRVGIWTITGTGLSSGLSASANVTVVAHALPVTGDDGTNLWLLLIGSAVAALGVVLVVLVRSRRPRAQA